MARLTGLVLLAALLWVGVTVYREGPDVAFDGAFAKVVEATRSGADESLGPMKRVGQARGDRANESLGDDRFRE